MTAAQQVLARIEAALERTNASWQRLPSWARLLAGYGAVVALSLVAVWPLFGGGMIATGDTLHVLRILEIGRCWEDGQAPCRWAPDLGNGYGYPLFNYYPPLPYYAGDVLHRLGLSYLRAVDALFVIGLVGAGVSMYTFARRLWGELGGLVSAVGYVYAPYLALDVYMRGALAELWAFALVPALLWAVHELLTSSRARWLPVVALLTGLLLLSHNLAALIAAPLMALWAAGLLGLRGREALGPAMLGLAGAAWGLGLAAFFTLPVLFEGDLVQLETLTAGPFDYALHYTSATDLFFERSGDYGFLLGLSDGTPVQIGWFHWALAALAVPAGALLWRSGRRVPAVGVAALCVAFAIGVFMATAASEVVWDAFGPLAYLQFPWRYLGLVSIASAGLAGAWFAVLNERPVALRLALALVVVGVLIGTGRTYFHSEYRFDVSEGDVLHGEAFAYLYGGSIRDYLPEAVDQIPEPRDARAEIVSGEGEVVSARAGSDWLTLEIEAKGPVAIEASVFDFPEWRVRVDGEEVSHKANAPNGLITFDVAAGAHEIELNLEDTNVRRAGNVISLVSWLALALVAPAMAFGPRLAGLMEARFRSSAEGSQ